MSYTSFKRKVVLVYVSLALGLLLLVVDLIELFFIRNAASSGVIPSEWASSMLLLHAGNFYVLLLGYVYSDGSHDKEGKQWSKVSLLVNGLSFACRLIVEIGYEDYRPITLVRD